MNMTAAISRNRLILGVIFFLLGWNHAQGSDPPAEFKLAGVKFLGIKSVSKKELAKTLSARVPPIWKFWRAPPRMTYDDLEDDLLRIQQFYEPRGYYNVRASYEIQELTPEEDTPPSPQPPEAPRAKPVSASPGKVPSIKVTFVIVEGPPVKIRNVNLKGRGVEGLAEHDLLAAIPLKTDQIFEIAEYQNAKKEIAKALGNKGYPFAKPNGRVAIDTFENVAEIDFEIDPGPPCAFGSVSIVQDDDYIKEEVVRRALAFKAGETYSADKVSRSQQNLFNLDIFKVVQIKPEAPQATETAVHAVPMRIDVKRKKRQSVKLGAGYGTEDGIRVRAAWTYRNLFGWGGRLSFNAKRSDLIESGRFEYTQPYFLDAKNTLGASSGIEREKLVSFTNLKIFGNAALQRNFARNWWWSVGYNLEFNRTEDIQVTDPVELTQLDEEKDFLVSSVRLGITRNTTDSELNPTKGSVASFTMEGASGYIGSELDFFKPAVELRKYLPLPWKMVLAGRARLETIEPIAETDAIPISKRLFLGGDNTVRGYDFQGLPPLDSGEDPLGGLTSINANVELRYPIYKDLAGVVFLDVGLLDESAFSADFGEERYSAGLGLRYHTIVGPIRLDFGYKLNPPKRRDIGDFNDPDKEIGDRWKIHFSIGQAF
ncbi:MAG: outer membrane protein assembly factor BamA [Desulfobacterales bacterium]|nr:MAG: outer membrane protein assembly factor BamA [Desulfobacterales bacterium]